MTSSTNLLTNHHLLFLTVLVVFKDGVDNYIKGDWPTAKAMLEKANALMATLAPNLGGDGPSKTLLEYMAEFSYMAPLDWKGYRPLTSK